MKRTLITLAAFCLTLNAGCALLSRSKDDASARTQTQVSENLSGRGGVSPAEAYFNKGLEAYRKNQDKEAAEAFKQAIALQPEYPEAHLKLGLVYSVLGQKEEATKEYETAVEQYKKYLDSQPEDPEAYFNLGLAYTKLSKYDDAVKAYKRAARLQPDDSEKQYELGLAHVKVAEYKEAVSALQKAINIDPDHYRAIDALEKAKAGVARRESILRQLERAEERAKKKAEEEAAAARESGESTTGPEPKIEPASEKP